MISFPLIFREVTVAARKKRTFLMRFVFGAVLAFMVLVFLVGRMVSPSSQAMGRSLLATFAWEMCILVFALAPALSCGCIADEKKEGTLGLLFLTDLNSADIILGKFIGKLFDVLLLVLAATPLLFVPILLGGVGWDQTLGVVVNLLALVLLTLSVGVFCSTITAGAGSATVLAYAGLVGFNAVVIILPQLKHAGFTQAAVVAVLELVPDWLALASPFCALSRGVLQDSLISLLLCGVVSCVLLAYSIWHLPWEIRSTMFREPLWRKWRSRPGHASPRTRLRPRKRPALDRNPILWLHFGRSRSRWVVQLVLAICLFVYVAYELVANDFDDGILGFLFVGGLVAAYVLKILMVLSAARSFATEKEDGALELILTSPFSDRQIVRGRLLAVLANYGGVYGIVLALILTGGLGLLISNPHEPIGVVVGGFCVGITLTGLALSLCVASVVSLWSRTVKQAITLAVLATVIGGGVMVQITYFGLLFMAMFTSFKFAGDQATMLLVGTGCALGRLAIDVVFACIAYRLLVSNLRKYAAR